MPWSLLNMNLPIKILNQTGPSGSTWFATFWTHYSMVKPSCSNFSVNTDSLSGMKIFWMLRYSTYIYTCICKSSRTPRNWKLPNTIAQRHWWWHWWFISQWGRGAETERCHYWQHRNQQKKIAYILFTRIFFLAQAFVKRTAILCKLINITFQIISK